MDLSELINKYESGTGAVIAALGDYKNRNIDMKHPDGWSPRQIVHHLADSEVNSYIRLRRLIGEQNGTPLPGYDEAAWALNPTMGYEVLPIENCLQLFIAVRQASADTLKRVTSADMDKTGIHSEMGKYTITTWFNSYIAHPFEHADQIVRAFQGQL